MGIKFLGTPIEQFDQLIKEEEKVTITVSCFKSEEMYYPGTDTDGVGHTMEVEDTLTGQWSQQIMSSKDIFQFDGDAAKVYAPYTPRNKILELVN